MKYAVTEGRSKPRNLKNKSLLSHPNYHLPRPADNSLPNTAQDAVDFFCCKDALLAHVQLFVHQDCQVFFGRAAFQLVRPQATPINGIIPPHMQDFALPFVELHEVPLSPFPQPFKVSYNAVVTLNTFTLSDHNTKDYGKAQPKCTAE